MARDRESKTTRDIPGKNSNPIQLPRNPLLTYPCLPTLKPTRAQPISKADYVIHNNTPTRRADLRKGFDKLSLKLIWGLYGLAPNSVRAEFVEASFHGQASIRIQVVFISVYFSKACKDLSLPLPLCLKPPKGTVMSSSSYWFTCTVPARIARATR